MLITLLTITAASSLMVDQHKIEIVSKEWVHSIYENRYQWMGDVTITEGSYVLNARVVVMDLNEAGQPCKIRAVGEPVEAEGLRSGSKVSVSGEVLLYDCKQNKVRIARDAMVQDSATQSTHTANNIIYDLITKQVTASGSEPQQTQLRLVPRG